MIKTIKKRTGDIVKFNAQKITDAIKKANMESIDETFSKEQLSTITNNVIKALKNLKTPGVEQIQDAVEKVLIAGNFASTAKAYILYRAEHTKLRQAKADLMDIYDELTFTKAKDADIKRENANIDADTAMGTMLKYGSEGSKYFITSHILPKDIAVAHMDGDIHIHDMDFYMLTETCCQIDLLKLFKNGFSTGHGYLREPNDIRSYAALACIAIQANQNEMHGGQAVPMFDYCMAPGVAKTYRKQYYKALGYYFNAMLDSLVTNYSSKVIFSFFLLSETILGLVPPEIFIAWASKFGNPWLYLFILASLSYLGGVIAYFIGNRLFLIPAVKNHIENKIAIHIKNLKKWGGLFVFIGAMLPLPHSIVSLACGMVKYDFKNYLFWALFRYVRFIIYALIIFQIF